MILSLLTALGGGLMRLLPELLGLLNKRTDNAHELAMLDRQLQFEQARMAARKEEVQLTTDAAQMLALLDAQKSALVGQAQLTGVWWIDALNILVRPLTTYYMLMLYGLAKVALFAVAVGAGGGVWQAVVQVYDQEDRALLTGILSFWFVGRVLDKKS
jgi:hypothetical protein